MAPRDFSDATSRLEQELQAPSQPAAADRRPLIRSVQTQMEAIARGDFEAVLAQALPTLALDIFAPPEFNWMRRARGLDEIRQALQQNFGSVDNQRPQITNVSTQADTVVLFGREQGRIRATSQDYDVDFVQKFTFENDRLATVQIIVAHRPTGQK